jgi:hypothetical protein
VLFPVRAAVLTPLYLSMSWVLTVSYQLFTDTAVRTIAFNVNSVFPAVSGWLSQNIEMVVFIYAFSWIFILPSVILAKERSVFMQFVVCLLLTLLALSIKDVLLFFGSVEIEQLFSFSSFLYNPLLAGVYLMVPYVVMVGLDFRSRRALKRRKELRKATTMLPELC